VQREWAKGEKAMVMGRGRVWRWVDAVVGDGCAPFLAVSSPLVLIGHTVPRARERGGKQRAADRLGEGAQKASNVVMP